MTFRQVAATSPPPSGPSQPVLLFPSTLAGTDHQRVVGVETAHSGIEGNLDNLLAWESTTAGSPAVPSAEGGRGLGLASSRGAQPARICGLYRPTRQKL